MAEKQIRIRGVALRGTGLSYVREILNTQKGPDGKDVGEWLRHDNEVLTKEQAEEVAKELGYKIVPSDAPMFVEFPPPAPPAKPAKTPKPE